MTININYFIPKIDSNSIVLISGNRPEPEISIQSNIAINVTDLKNKIFGIEKKLSEISRICMEKANGNSEDFIDVTPRNYEEDKLSQQYSEQIPNETKVIFQPNSGHKIFNDDSESLPKSNEFINNIRSNERSNKNHKDHESNAKNPVRKKRKVRKKSIVHTPEDISHLRKYKSYYQCNNVYNPNFSATSYHSLSILTPREDKHVLRHSRKHKKHRETSYKKVFNYVPQEPLICYEDRINYKVKTNTANVPLDSDFIENIIEKQYKPLKLFGRTSNFSQISAPNCKDRDYNVNTTMENSVCSSAFVDERFAFKRNYMNNNNMGSICDTRLYSNKRISPPKPKYYNKYIYNYNDSALYDIIPVKEKSSPKTRRKFEEDLIRHQYCRAVPPSPRTNRPKLNLQTQFVTESDISNFHTEPNRHVNYYTESESVNSEMLLQKQNKLLRKRLRKQMYSQEKFIDPEDFYKNNEQPAAEQLNKNENKLRLNNNDALLDNSINCNKTDKALNEIKDILQTFLHEIKKEAATNSVSDKSDMTTPKTNNNEQIQNTPMTTNSNNMNRAPNMGTCNLLNQPIQSFNPFCYSMLPVYPMNSMHNAYMMPNNSVTCPTCIHTKHNPATRTTAQNISPRSDKTTKNKWLTEEVIKEIHKCIALKDTQTKSPRINLNNKDSPRKSSYDGQITSRSVDKSNYISKCDAQVGTPRLKCYSKSCEAIGSKIMSDTNFGRNQGVHSDTVLEKLSLDARATRTFSDIDLTEGISSTSVKV